MAPLKRWMETYLWVGSRFPEIHSLSSISLQPGGWSWAVTFLICVLKASQLQMADALSSIVMLWAGHLSTAYLPWFSCRHTSKSNWVYWCLHFSLAKDKVCKCPFPVLLCLSVVAIVFPGDPGDHPGGKESAFQCRSRRRLSPWVGKIPRTRKWQPTPVFLPGESHGQRSLVGYSP